MKRLRPFTVLTSAIVVVVAATILTLVPSPASAGGEEISYTFEFVNGRTVTGIADDKNFFIPDAGGTSADSPTGMQVHLSCSDRFGGGWGDKGSPRPGTDSAWQIASYFILDLSDGKRCGTPPPPAPPPDPPAIDIEKYVNGDDADTPTGPEIELGGTATFTYEVANTGGIPLRNVVVTDSILGPITCPRTELGVGESMSCDPQSETTTAPGQFTMKATVTGIGDILTPAPPPTTGGKGFAYRFTFANGITLIGTSPDKEAFIAGAGGTSATSPTGMRVHLSCSDKFIGGWGQKDGPTQGVDTAWQISSYSIAKFKDGRIKKTCGDPFSLPVEQEVMDMDPVHFIVPPPPADPKIDIEKYVNGHDADTPPGPTLRAGETAEFTYVVTNTGDVPLVDVAVRDNVVGAITCPRTELGVGESMDCQPTTMEVEVGQQFMEACVEGFGDGRRVDDCDPVYYYVPPPPTDPKIDIEKYVDGHDADTPPGPTLEIGRDAVFTYVVTNTGDVPLTEVSATDNVIGPLTCPRSELGVGESMDCQPTTMVVEYGQQSMKACVTGMNGGREVSDCDPVFYRGEKETEPAWIGDHVSYEHSGRGAGDVKIDLFETGSDGMRARFLGDTRTDDNGDYGFHPQPGCYTLVFIAPYGWEFVGGNKYLELMTCVEAGETDNSLDAVLRRIG